MSETIHVGTRKGLFTLRHARGQWQVTRVSFLGDPVSMLLPDARDGSLYAALKLGHFGVKLHRSTDGGATWQPLAAPSFAGQSAAPTTDRNGQPAEPTVEQVWALEGGGPDQPGVLWAGALHAGLFRSADHGQSWTLVRSLWERPERAEWVGGGADLPGIHSIVVDPRNSWWITVGVSCGGVWQSRDGGETWACRATGMRAEYMPPERQFDPNIQDPHRVVQCPAQPDAMWAQHHNGIFRTTSNGERWEEVTAAGPSRFGFAVAVHPTDPDTAWFVPAVKDELRVPVDGRVVVTRTRDGGQTLEVLSQGLPGPHAYDLVYRHCLEVDSSGRRLAFGSTTGGLWTSDDGGESWQALPARLPPVYCLRFGS